ncbi:hypothetical protein, partial [Streptomyces olindensis]|uniref:hypothetical protein n=1 Tax=Streptomyces olindensis TaxID=358823 RepID=UPI0033C70EB5
MTTVTATVTTAPTITGSMPHIPLPEGLLGYRPRIARTTTVLITTAVVTFAWSRPENPAPRRRPD